MNQNETNAESAERVRCSAWLGVAIKHARAAMYKRTIGMTLEESDKHRTWIDATLAEVDAQLMSPNNSQAQPPKVG